MKLADERAILGIDPSRGGLAFVFFERGKLVEWGNRSAADELTILKELLHHYSPEVLVLEDSNHRCCRRAPPLRRALRSLADRAELEGAEVLRVSRDAVRRDWAARGITTKEAVAAELARQFSDLNIAVPRLRKIYRSEDKRIRMFDAAAFVLWACGSETVD